MAGMWSNNLRFLIVDDFSSFRSTVTSMLNSLGVIQIGVAANGAEALEICRHKKFDVILCDYDLGPGKNGQRVLEAMRHLKLIDRETLFVLISADVSKTAVMAAYDCMPDDYMAKPINAQMIERRIGRLLEQREVMRPAFRALDRNDPEGAMEILTQISISSRRPALASQKFLGELFIEYDELNKAEKLYRAVLVKKPLDWARLGLAYVQQARGNLKEAGETFESLAEQNPLYLPAYDGMASNWYLRKDTVRLQQAIADSVEVSPMSILRQKNLANIARKNGDIPTALQALRECVKLGRESCFGEWDDAYQFGMTAAAAPDAVLRSEGNLPAEALIMLAEANKFFDIDPDQMLRMQFLEGRLHYLAKHGTEALRAIEKAERIYESRDQDIETDIAHVRALQTIGETDRAEELTHQLIQHYSYDQEALERLDELLGEPVSEANRALVTQINKEGIALYNKQLFDDAITCFERAKILFPKHAGIRLNIVQALIGKISMVERDIRIKLSAEAELAIIGELIDEGHSQYKRYLKLCAMVAK